MAVDAGRRGSPYRNSSLMGTLGDMLGLGAQGLGSALTGAVDLIGNAANVVDPLNDVRWSGGRIVGRGGGGGNTMPASAFPPAQPNNRFTGQAISPLAGRDQLEPPAPPRFPGGGGGSSSSFSQSAGLAQMRQAQERAAGALASLDQRFEDRKAELRQEYQLSETPEEKAMLQRQLDVIETQRQAGTAVIRRVYNTAIRKSGKQAASAREAGVAAGGRTQETFDKASQDTADMWMALNKEMGGTTGAGGEPLPESVQAQLGNMQEQGADEAAFDRRVAGLTADDIAFLGEAMRGEKGAQVAALQRDAVGATTNTQLAHQAAVMDRIAQERSNWQNALAGLANIYDQRRFGLQDQMIGLDAQSASMASQNARSSSQGMSPQQEFALALEQNRYERELEDYEQQRELRRQQNALIGLGVHPGTADFASQLGLGQDLGVSILFPQPTIDDVAGLQAGR